MSEIGVVTATTSGRRAAQRLADAWPERVDIVTAERPADALRTAFGRCRMVVSFLAVGATVRVLAPLLDDKTTDPAVVCVDESSRYAVAVLGGHNGANALAHRIAEVLGCEPVITTASDSAETSALDTYGADLGFTVANRELLPRVGTAVLSGEPVRLEGAEPWPLPALPDNVSPAVPEADAAAIIRVTDHRNATAPPAAGAAPVLAYHPPSLVVGVGAARGVSAAEVGELVDSALAELSHAAVRALATVDVKADEEGILDVARRRGWEVDVFTAADLAGVEVPNPSDVVREEVGTPSVAEAAALRAARDAGCAAELVVAKRKSTNATVAVARMRPRGRLAVVGIGPGARDLLPPRAAAELRRAAVVVGLDQYVDQVRDLLRPGTRVLATGLGQEEERARTAVSEASGGAAVALVGSGDAGVYAMASPTLQARADTDRDIDVVGVPGITAAVAASSLLGAPLGHDHAYISLSDLHTPWEAIESRVRAAAESDLTVCFYNPRSRGREWQLPRALEILAGYRPEGTPVGYVRSASREGERVTLSNLADMLAGETENVDMLTVVIVGSSVSGVVAGRFVTPRGYRWREAPVS